MKKTLVLFLGTVCLSSCEIDYYNGDERIVVEGIVVSNNEPLSYAKIEVFPSWNTPKNGIITQIDNYEDNYYYEESGSGSAIAVIRADKNGKVSLSFPRSTETNVYKIRVSSYNDVKTYGYISEYNSANYYVNLGTLNF